MMIVFSHHIYQYTIINNNNNLLHLYSAFLGTQSALHRRGGGGGGISSSTTSVQRPPEWCDGSHSAPEHPPHTAYWWRGDRVMKTISVWRWLGGHDGQRPVGEFGQDTGVTPLLFFEGHPGIYEIKVQWIFIQWDFRHTNLSWITCKPCSNLICALDLHSFLRLTNEAQYHV